MGPCAEALLTEELQGRGRLEEKGRSDGAARARADAEVVRLVGQVAELGGELKAVKVGPCRLTLSKPC